MENASKALIMAAEILIGVMIISVIVYLVNVFGDFSSSLEEKRQAQEISVFNENFYSLQGRKDITIHEIITIAKFAQEANKEDGYNIKVYFLTTSTNLADTSTNYINDYLKDETKVYITNLTTGSIDELKKYKVKEIIINENSHRVDSIQFIQ